MNPPSVQSPFARCPSLLHRGDVFRLLGGRYPSVLAPTDSCANPRPLSTPSALASFEESSPVATSPAASGIFPTLSLRIFPWMLGPLPRRDPRVLLPVSSSGVIGLPQISIRSASRFFPPKRFLGGDNFRGCRHFFMFGPPSLLAPQIVPTAARLRAGQPGLLRPSRTCVVASACIGYASHPNTGN